MRTIQELLAGKPEALAHVEALIAKHDVWVVGGAARCLLYPFLPFPSDIDLLLNTELPANALLAIHPQTATTGSGGQGQKIDLGGIKLDVFDNGLTRWLHGTPLHGDGLAVRALDNFVLMTEGFHRLPWTQVNPAHPGMRPDYLERHVLSLQRDMNAIAELAAIEFGEACHGARIDGGRS